MNKLAILILSLSQSVFVYSSDFCYNKNELFPPLSYSENDEINIEADQSSIKNKNFYELEGNVYLKTKDYSVNSSKVSINKSTRNASFSGGVNYQTPNINISSDKGQILNNKNYVFTNSSYLVPESKLRGNAKLISGDENVLNLDYATYTLCPLKDSSWNLEADKVSLDTEENLGQASNVFLNFKGFPIFYSPTYSWVLKGRGSGFLAPSFSTYDETSEDEKNFKTSIPYYFNLDLDRDLLMNFDYLSSRGLLIGGKYRQLLYSSDGTANGKFDSEVNILNSDKISKKDRWSIENNLELNPNKNSIISLNISRVSDKNYFKDIEHQNTDIPSLVSFISFSKFEPENKFSTSFYSESEQLVNNGAPSYTRNFESSISKEYQLDKTQKISTNIILNNFGHSNSSNTTGIRTHLDSEYSKTFSNNIYSIVPKFKLLQTNYKLDSTDDISRSIYQFKVNSDINLERELKFDNIKILQTLTPQISYNFTNKKIQNQIPLFDSELINTSYDNLHSGKKFSGIDRISNDNSFTLGVNSDFINDRSGETLISLAAAQKFRLNDKELNAEGNFTSVSKQSNIATTARLNINNFSLTSNIEFKKNISVEKSNLLLQYFATPRNLLNLSYEDQIDKNIDLSGVWTVTPNIHFFGKINRNLSTNVTNKNLAGIGYESCCWALRLGHEKEYLGSNDWDHKFEIELVLKGLSSLSPSYTKKLAKEIPNYFSILDEI